MRVVTWLLLFPATALAGAPIQQGSNLGLGVGGGSTASGLSAKYFIGSDFAVQGIVGPWNPLALDLLNEGNHVSNGALGFELAMLLESQPFVNGSFADLAFNYGLGVGLVPTSGPEITLVPIGGFELNIETIPVDLVLEYRPPGWVYPDFRYDFVGFGAHLRVYPFPTPQR